MRLGEAFALDIRADIDFENKTLTVNRQIQWIDGYWVFTDPKYDSFRTIHLDDYMLDVLLKVKDLQERAAILYGEYYTHLYVNEKQQLISEKKPGCIEVHLLNIREDGTYIQPRVMQHCSRVIHYDLGYKNFDYHSLRHTHATMLIESGAPIKDVQRRLGHKSVQVTLDIYSHVTAKMQMQTIDILNHTPITGAINKYDTSKNKEQRSSENMDIVNSEELNEINSKWHKNSSWGTRLYPR